MIAAGSTRPSPLDDSAGDVTIASDTDASGAGDIIFETGGVQRGRIGAAGGSSLLSAHYDPRLQWLGADLKRMLVGADESFALAWLTDSTGNDVPGGGSTGDWPYELALLIAAAYPAYTVN